MQRSLSCVTCAGEQSVHIIHKRNQTCRSRLKMVVVRGGRTALGAIIEEYVI